MAFAIIARDATDDQAMDRRMAARDDHFKYMDRQIRQGNMIYGGAMLDDNGAMVGSIIITDFATREEVDSWLQDEPYMTQKVWDSLEITELKTGKPFKAMVKSVA